MEKLGRKGEIKRAPKKGDLSRMIGYSFILDSISNVNEKISQRVNFPNQQKFSIMVE